MAQPLTTSTANIIPVKRKFCFTQMKSTETTAALDRIVEDTLSKNNKGMNNFPLEVYNKMIEYSLNNGKFRNAMLMVCMANWGMRYSDVVRVRFSHIFDSDGNFRSEFSLQNGEKKTRKEIIYYNNEATVRIIDLYLSQPENRDKTRLDFLFVSESFTGNCPVETVQQLEADDLYNSQISLAEKALNKIPDKEKRVLQKYADGKITDENFTYMMNFVKSERTELEKQLDELTQAKQNYESPTPNADKIYIQKPLSHTAGENIIKNTLKEIGINPKNRKNKEEFQTTDSKYNTHSLRKTFADCFVRTGEELMENGKLAYNRVILDLLTEKFKHSCYNVTAHYTDEQQKAFAIICQNLNIGLDVVENYF